ncbi:MAG: class I SAM-dependent rRNA methyltransferase [candidate division Zixibacteria bacterium]|nr:class I SAM-dependent rRNA methyltransferase [candidate division Zixibacteria bacterium]
MYPKFQLNPGKDILLSTRHPWLFSGALRPRSEQIPNGTLVTVANEKGEIVATGTYSKSSNISVRIFEFADVSIDKAWLVTKIEKADSTRRLLGYGPGTNTTGYRVIFGEADNIPGLVVDRYGDRLVIQLATGGTDLLRDTIIEALVEVFKPKTIVERSDLPSRKEEGLQDKTGIVYGDTFSQIEFTEESIRFFAEPISGQKTGFYLDQKELRKEIRKFAQDRVALNLFSYTGAHSVAALIGGAKSVLNIDSSEAALAGCKHHAELNGLSADTMLTEQADVFQWLSPRHEPTFDMVIIDPPALIKSRKDIESGQKGYHFLNRAAIRMLKDGGILVTSSCSQFFTQDDFLTMLRKASIQSGVRLELLKFVQQSPDHPISVYFPESAYLKSFVCRVTR